MARPPSARTSKTSDGRAVQLPLDGLVRADKVAKPPRRTEKVLQQHTRGALSGLGYATMETGTGRPHVCCPNCTSTFVPQGFMGNAVGLPDLLVFRYVPGFPAIAALVEMKGEGTKITTEQQQLADAGRSVIAHSIEDAVRAVLAAEEAMDAYRFSPQRRELFHRFLKNNQGQLG